MEADRRHMRRALALAERGRGRTSPNPMVGAVVVDRVGVVVGRGWHEAAGGPHAEVVALADAGERARGATLYCTLEPCVHVGRTGPCAPLVVAAGIRRAVVAVRDPNPLVAGRGIAHLQSHGLQVETGLLAGDATRLNAPFFTRMRLGRPFVTLKEASSLDGYVSAGPGVRTPLTGAAVNRAVHRERAEIDAVAIGSGTVLTDDPLLTARGAYRHRPLIRVVFDRRLRTPPAARLLSTLEAGPVLIFATAAAGDEWRARAAALSRAGAQVETVADDSSSSSFLVGCLRRLGELGCSWLLVEGGPTLQTAFWRAGLVDRLELFLSPRVIGTGGVPGAALPPGTIAALADAAARPLGDDVLIEGYVHRID